MQTAVATAEMPPDNTTTATITPVTETFNRLILTGRGGQTIIDRIVTRDECTTLHAALLDFALAQADEFRSEPSDPEAYRPGDTFPNVGYVRRMAKAGA